SALRTRDDLQVAAQSSQPIPVEVWQEGHTTKRDLGPGTLGVVLDPRPVALAIRDQRRLDQVLIAARSGPEHFQRLPRPRPEVEALARLFQSARRPARLLTDTQASEPGLEQLAASGALGRFAYIHLATHGVIDEASPLRSSVILTQTGLPDPLAQVLRHQPAY